MLEGRPKVGGREEGKDEEREKGKKVREGGSRKVRRVSEERKVIN